ncbi:hypothetical protein [Paenibacillus aquistagni]|uniref:hypothetical protein n=1 Tax=Paenibacillus aquistagni TaxID=1852522 RepID=UPI0014824C62|nr:hypothetical protein [Paenibacillus aquistagni]
MLNKRAAISKIKLEPPNQVLIIEIMFYKSIFDDHILLMDIPLAFLLVAYLYGDVMDSKPLAFLLLFRCPFL